MQAFADRPLSAVGLDKYVLLRSRSERSLPQVSGVMPFDLKRHPSSKSKITQVSFSRPCVWIGDWGNLPVYALEL